MTTPDPRRISHFLLLVVLFLYARVIFCGWVNWDDTIYFSNPYLQQGLSLTSLHWALTDTSLVHQWIPMTWLSILVDQALFDGNPAGSHLINLLLHAANTVLLFNLLHRMTQRVWPTFFVAALFAVHPQHVEAVAWATERKEVLAAFFGLLSLHQYVTMVQARTGGGTWQDVRVLMPLGWSLVCYFLSLTAKPMWITLPFLLLLLDGWPLGRLHRPWWPLLAEKLPYLPIMLALVLITFRVYETPSFAPGGVSVWDLLPFALVNDLHYVTATLWPVGLAPLYPMPLVRPDPLHVAGAALLLLVITATAWRLARSHPWLLMGWLWFMGTLFLVSGIIHVGRHATTDRFTYLPHMGLFTALAWEADHGLRRWQVRPRGISGMALAILGMCAALTWNQIGVWQDSRTLWSSAVANTRNNHYAHYMLAGLSMEERNLTQAAAEIQRALTILPEQIDYRLLQADILYRGDKKTEALNSLRLLAEKHPDMPKVSLKMAMIHMQERAFSQALPLLRQIVDLDAKGEPLPAHAADVGEAGFQLGVALAMQGEGIESRQHLTRVFARQPHLKAQRCSLLRDLARPHEAGQEIWPALAGEFCAVPQATARDTP
ncbi:MAG: hypothetical protein HQL64_09785 [Magnetococcales bacterium]|nr:hypothetical protein [Magnetococcales bacterium]